MKHTFNGGNAALVGSIRALLSLNEAKAVSHPVPGMAVQLLSVAADRLDALATPTPSQAKAGEVGHG